MSSVVEVVAPEGKVNLDQATLPNDAPATAPQVEPLAATESSPTRRRRRKKNKKPFLNDWDVPEEMPGAMPRANAVQRDLFVRRCKDVWNWNQYEDQVYEFKKDRARQLELSKALDDDLMALFAMFPSLEPSLIQDIFLQPDGADKDKMTAIELLLPLAETGETVEKRVEVSDPSAFPLLTDNDGWEVIPRKSSIFSENAEKFENIEGGPSSYLEALKRTSTKNSKKNEEKEGEEKEEKEKEKEEFLIVESENCERK